MRLIPLTALACIGCNLALAQNQPLPDKNISPLPKKTEVSVVLDDLVPSPTPDPPQTPAPTKPEEKTAGDSKQPADTSNQPVLVTGRPPAEAILPPPEKEPAPKPETGVTIRVEKVQIHSKKIDPLKVTLAAPFPAKPLSEPPPGWKLDVRPDAKPFLREVEIAPGTNISLKISPHVLVPIADGTTIFNVNEPGFDPERQYQQLGTVGAILTDSVESLDNQARQLGDAIDRIQQLLVSLPSSEPTQSAPPPKAEPVKMR